MYINIELLKKSKLILGDVEKLCSIKFKNLLKFITKEDLDRYTELDLITFVKGKETEFERARLSSKGKNLLISFSYEGAPDDESLKIRDWLVDHYKNKSGGIIKNKTEIARRLQWFKTITQINKNHLVLLIKCFLEDTYSEDSGLSVKDFMIDNPRGVLSNLLDNLIWNPPNNFAKNYTLADSPLYNYFENNKEYVENVWKLNLSN